MTHNNLLMTPLRRRYRMSSHFASHTAIRIFFYLLDVVTSNALLLYNESVNKNQRMNIFKFKAKLIETIVGIKLELGDQSDTKRWCMFPREAATAGVIVPIVCCSCWPTKQDSGVQVAKLPLFSWYQTWWQRLLHNLPCMSPEKQRKCMVLRKRDEEENKHVISSVN